MNGLEQYLAYTGMPMLEAMNALQEYGVIADNCILPREVYNTGEAVRWLIDNYGNPKPRKKKP